MHGIEDLLAQWQQFRADTLAQWLYRIRKPLEGNRLLNMYQATLVSAVLRSERAVVLGDGNGRVRRCSWGMTRPWRSNHPLFAFRIS